MKHANPSFNSHVAKWGFTSSFCLAPNFDYLPIFNNWEVSPKKSGFTLSFGESGDLVAMNPHSVLAKSAVTGHGSPHVPSICHRGLRSACFALPPTPWLCRCEMGTGPASLGGLQVQRTLQLQRNTCLPRGTAGSKKHFL